MFLSGVEFLLLLLIELSILVMEAVEAGWNGPGGLLQNQICQILPKSPKSPNSVLEVFPEVSEPNPMGNAVVLEETHGNAVAGAATASAAAQPSVDTASLASSCTNKHHCMRHASLGTVALF